MAGPEAANNAATAGAMVPLLSLGIPFSPATAILLGALVITGIQPGPLLISQRPEVFWGVVASMYVGNVLLLILNLPLVGVFVSVLRLPQHVLATMVLLLCLVGAYSLNNSQLDLWVLVGFGIFGYGLRKLAIDPSPLVVALVLGADDGEDAPAIALHGAGQCARDREPAAHCHPAGPWPGRPRGAAGGAPPAPGRISAEPARSAR